MTELRAELKAVCSGELDALRDAEEILIVGPSSGKLDVLRHLHKHDPALEGRVLGVETLDHPTDRQLAAYVRHYFQEKDRTLDAGKGSH